MGSAAVEQFNYPNTISSAETSPGGWTIGNLSSYTQENGGEWLSSGGAHTMFSVSVVSQVPEPGAYSALAGAAVLSFALARRRMHARG